MSAVRPIMIAAGGTGGHVYPALAVAAALRAAGVPVVWMGTQAGLEARVVPAAGLEIEWLRVAGLRGKGWAARVRAPFSLARAGLQALAILRRRRPRALLGMGGFAAGPGGLMARLIGCPLVVHEQNAVAGVTNRILARLARRVLEAVPGTFPAACRATAVGNPVRAEISAIAPPEERLAGRTGALRLLVLGGSQGARTLNERLPRQLGRLPAARRPTVRHVAGPRHVDAARAAYADAGVEASVEDYVEDMAAAWAWADAVVARAGAMTVAEIEAVGIAALLVPFPHAVDDHQTANARPLVDAGAAALLQEAELDDARLLAGLEDLLTERSALSERGRRARSLARPAAADETARILLEVAR